jgi:hypothetical protein
LVVSKETAWNLGISGRYRLNENHTFFAGLSWYQPSINKSEQTDNYNTNQLTAILSQKNPSGLLTYYENALITQLTPESKRDLVGLYLQHKYQINQQVALTWGGTLRPLPRSGGNCQSTSGSGVFSHRQDKI